jgi:hypothetical protein
MLTDLRVFMGLVAITIVGLLGLFMAAKAELESSYNLGLGVFFAAVIVGAILVKRSLDDADAR